VDPVPLRVLVATPSPPPPSIPIAACTPVAACSTADHSQPAGVGRVKMIGCLGGVEEVAGGCGRRADDFAAGDGRSDGLRLSGSDSGVGGSVSPHAGATGKCRTAENLGWQTEATAIRSDRRALSGAPHGETRIPCVPSPECAPQPVGRPVGNPMDLRGGHIHLPPESLDRTPRPYSLKNTSHDCGRSSQGTPRDATLTLCAWGSGH